MNKKYNNSKIDINEQFKYISYNSIILFKAELLKIITPFHFAYQNIYTFN